MRANFELGLLALCLYASGARAQTAAPSPARPVSQAGATQEGAPSISEHPSTGTSENPDARTGRRATPVLDLSPRAAAEGALKTTSDSDAAPAAAESENALAERLPGLVRSANATAQQRLERAAEDAIWLVLKPWEIGLREGRYWYIGRGFDAAIRSDGSIEYRSKDGLTLSFVPIMERKGLQTKIEPDGPGQSVVIGTSIPGFGIGIADPGSALSRTVTGQDFHTQERREFLQKTQALREQLMNLSMQRKRLSADLLLVDTLRRLWQTSDVPLFKAQQATFAMWDACATDAIGDAAHKSIEAFFRELVSERGECPFSVAVLHGFNQRRKSPQAFAPCAAPGASPVK